ncbi:radical SAM protein [bacterium]|nr:MAG: radical SAM protein [bacterium]
MKQENIPLSVLCVISKLNANRGTEVFNWYQSLGVSSFGLLPLKNVPLSERPNIPTNEELFQFYKTIFDLWLWTPNKFSYIEPLDSMIRSILGQQPRGCSFSNPCLKRMIAIDQNGNVIPCSSLASNDFILGNILERPLNQVLRSSKIRKLAKMRTHHVAKHCYQCKYIAICRGGCRADAYWATGKYDGDYPFCEARIKTFDYIKQTFQNISKNKQATP